MSRTFGLDLSGTVVQVDSTPITAYGCTAFAWYRPDTQDYATNGRSVTNIANSANSSMYFGMTTETSGAFGVVARNTTYYANLTTRLLDAQAWNACAVTFASATDRMGYLAGLDDTTIDPTTGVVASVTLPTGLNRLTIGRLGDSTPNQEAYGAIAHVAWWDVVLTQEELERLMLGRVSPMTVRPSNLKFYTPYLGRNSPEIDIIGGRQLTVTSAGVSSEEPPMLWMPKRKTFASILARQRILKYPNSVLAMSGIAGSYTDVNEPPGSPDSNWWTR